MTLCNSPNVFASCVFLLSNVSIRDPSPLFLSLKLFKETISCSRRVHRMVTFWFRKWSCCSWVCSCWIWSWSGFWLGKGGWRLWNIWTEEKVECLDDLWILKWGLSIFISFSSLSTFLLCKNPFQGFEFMHLAWNRTQNSTSKQYLSIPLKRALALTAKLLKVLANIDTMSSFDT